MKTGRGKQLYSALFLDCLILMENSANKGVGHLRGKEELI